MGKQVATSAAKNIAAQRESMEDRLRGLGGGSGVSTIRLKNRHFVFPDEELVPNELEVIVLDWALFNSYYKSEFVQGQTAFPDCFAVGQRAVDMVPSKNSPEIQNDGDPCATCWANQFGSGKGNGKACQNRINLAVLLYDEGSEGDLYKISVSPTGIKGWKEYVGKLASKGRAPADVVTLLSFDKKVAYDKLVFAASLEATKDPEFKEDSEACFERIPEATEYLLSEPSPPSDEDE